MSLFVLSVYTNYKLCPVILCCLLVAMWFAD